MPNPAKAKVPGTILKEEPTFAVLQCFKPKRAKTGGLSEEQNGKENNDEWFHGSWKAFYEWVSLSLSRMSVVSSAGIRSWP